MKSKRVESVWWARYSQNHKDEVVGFRIFVPVVIVSTFLRGIDALNWCVPWCQDATKLDSTCQIPSPSFSISISFSSQLYLSRFLIVILYCREERNVKVTVVQCPCLIYPLTPRTRSCLCCTFQSLLLNLKNQNCACMVHHPWSCNKDWNTGQRCTVQYSWESGLRNPWSAMNQFKLSPSIWLPGWPFNHTVYLPIQAYPEWPCCIRKAVR